MSRPLLIDGMKGLGDNVYQRPFVRATAAEREVYLSTPWPELYADLPVKVVRTNTILRTQALNERRQPASAWSVPPANAERVTIAYGHEALRTASIPATMERRLPLGRTPFVFDLPDMGPSPVRSSKPIAVVRPVTVRSEWRNEARNPRPEYVQWVARQLRRTHHVVTVAHLSEGQEWLDGELPEADQALVRGELSVRQLLALVREASVVVGGVGWLVPAAIATGTPAFVILGGQGAHNGPDKITDPRMNLSRVGWARPAHYCRCDNMRHRCVKLIPDLPEQWAAFASRQALEVAA